MELDEELEERRKVGLLNLESAREVGLRQVFLGGRV